MNILITSIVDLRKTSHNRLHQFIKYLSKNHEISVLSINDWWKSGQTDVNLYSKDFEDVLQKIEMVYFTKRKVNPFLQEISSIVTININSIFKDYKSFDVHLNYNTLISGYAVGKKVKSMDIATVYDIAEDLPQMIRNSPQIPSPLRPFGGLVGDVMIKKNIKVAEKITFITNSLKDSYNIPQNKAEFIPNGVDTALFESHPPEQLREELNLKQDFVIGYVGILREWVDFEPVFAAVKSLEKEYPDIKILIIGEEGGFKENKDLAGRYGLLDRVIFTGTIPYGQVPKYIACMDICLIPFKLDAVSESSLPLKLFEYMACEKPVISTKLKGIVEAVNDKVLYASNNSREYESKIIELYADEELRRRMGLEGRKFVEKNYNWSKIVDKLEKVLLGLGG